MNWLDAKCSSIVLDVSENDDALHRAISETCSFYKRSVSCMINNAGVMSLGDISTQNSSEWERMFRINSVSSTIHTCGCMRRYLETLLSNLSNLYSSSYQISNIVLLASS